MNMSRRENTQRFVLLCSAWVFYGACQNDWGLVILALVLVLPSYLYLMFSRRPRFFSFDLSWRILCAIAIALGLIWRTMLPDPISAISFIPVLLPAVQTACVIASIFVWYRFRFEWRGNALTLLAWGTVAASMNVKFDSISNSLFWAFCFINIAFHFAEVFEPPKVTASHKPIPKTWSTSVYPILLFVMALGVFYVLVRGIQLGDDAFMRLIRDYMGHRRFLLFDSKLKLNGYEGNWYAVKPVLELDRSGRDYEYLAAQVFESYSNGTWTAAESVETKPLPQTMSPSAKIVELTMYEFLQDLIPSPRGVTGFASKRASLEKDPDGIIFNSWKTIPEVTLFMEEKEQLSAIDEATYQKFLQIDPALAKDLEPRVGAIVGEEKDPIKMAWNVQQYFVDNYRYTLNVDFVADDKGLLSMLDNRRPAYCSYFASAMVLLLRQQHIPARVMSGFLATEVSGWNKDKFMVRGRDAHAWVEVFVPALDRHTKNEYESKDGLRYGRWLRFDPTPSVARQGAVNASDQINALADFIWCSQKRLKAALLNIETKTLVRVLVIIVVLVALEEVVKNMIKRLRLKKKIKDDLRRGIVSSENENLVYYKMFEKYMKDRWTIMRQDSQTDAELISQLRARKDISVELIRKIEGFLRNYHAVRFGGKLQGDLEKELQLIRSSR